MFVSVKEGLLEFEDLKETYKQEHTMKNEEVRILNFFHFLRTFSMKRYQKFLNQHLELRIFQLLFLSFLPIRAI